jgi:FlaG/FlaF family flagellin (archaellin)
MNDAAISPVVGVMLMLVVVIIIAAIASGFAGSLVTGQKAAPTLAMDVTIKNSGTWLGSGFFATVTGVSAPIPTSDLKIVTSWTTTNKMNPATQVSITTTTIPGFNNTYFHMGGRVNGVQGFPKSGVTPFGLGPGVGNNQSYSSGGLDSNPTNPYQYTADHFGNYTLMQGTTLFAIPAGASSMGSIGSVSAANDVAGYGISPASFYNYTTGTGNDDYQAGESDQIQGVLGQDWDNLRAGDVVNVKVIHVPSGKTIFQKDVLVTEG